MRRNIIPILTLAIGGLVVLTMTMVAPACATKDTEVDPDASATTDGATVLQGPAGSGLGTGLPCDVQAVIENRCIACHDGKQAGTPPLLQYSDLVAPSTKDPTKSRAVVAVELMQGNAMPPRPAAPPELDEIASFADWVKAGTPKEQKACTDAPPPSAPTTSPDGGVLPPDDGGGGTCSSGKVWTQANTGSPLMHPGVACNACHQVLGGPNSRFAGTVYLTAHENNDCNGVAPPPQLSVIITDAKNQVYTLPVNEAGNFVELKGAGAPPKAPFKAKVTDGTKTRAMNGSVTSGDCNSCHTTAGLNGAPGRIMAP